MTAQRGNSASDSPFTVIPYSQQQTAVGPRQLTPEQWQFAWSFPILAGLCFAPKRGSHQMSFALPKWSFCAVFAARLFFVLPLQAADDAAAVLKESGVRGGFVAHVNCGDGTLTAGLKPNDSY